MEIAREGEREREGGREEGGREEGEREGEAGREREREGGGGGGGKTREVLSSKLCSRLTNSKNELHTLLIFGGISTCGCSTLRGW